MTITATYGTLTRSVNLTKVSVQLIPPNPSHQIFLQYRDGLETFCQKAEDVYARVPFPQEKRGAFDANLQIFRQECGSLNVSFPFLLRHNVDFSICNYLLSSAGVPQRPFSQRLRR